MNAVNPCCSNCGFLLDADCDFCPSCGAVRGRPNPAPTRTRDPHGRMNDSAAPVSPPHVSAPVQASNTHLQPVSYAAVAAPGNSQDSGLAATARTMGIVAISFMAVALIPCLGWLNYLNLTLSFITLVLSIVALASAKSDAARSSALVGLLLVVTAGFIGVFRLILGGGCL